MIKKLMKKSGLVLLACILLLVMGITAYAEDDSENVDTEQQSFTEEGTLADEDEFDCYVDGIYNVGANARASMAGVIRFGRSGTKLLANYTTTYTHTVDRIGIKNVKLQYKGSLGIWHTIVTLDDRYSRNDSVYMGSFSCTGVFGRTYRMKGTHYIIDGSYTETRNNVTLELTF